MGKLRSGSERGKSFRGGKWFISISGKTTTLIEKKNNNKVVGSKISTTFASIFFYKTLKLFFAQNFKFQHVA